MRKHDLSYSKVERSGDSVHAANELRVNKLEELLLNVGYGRIPADVVDCCCRKSIAAQRRSPRRRISRPAFAAGPPHAGHEVARHQVAGEDDVLVRFAALLAGSRRSGDRRHYTRRGVTVHARSCSTALEQPEERRIEIEWDSDHKTARPVSVQVVCADKPGLLATDVADLQRATASTSRRPPVAPARRGGP